MEESTSVGKGHGHRRDDLGTTAGWLRVPSILTPWLVPFPPVRYWTPGRAEHGRMVECVTDAGLDCGLG